MYQRQAITLCSGGLDSVVLAHYLAACGYHQVLLTVDYAQKARPELSCAALCAERLGIDHACRDIDIPSGGSYLIGDAPISTSADDKSHTAMYVPNRNIIFLAHAFAYAIHHNSEFVAAAIEGDRRNLAPENYHSAIVLYEQAQMEAIKGKSTAYLYTPFSRFTKDHIVALGYALGVNFQHTWSCYDNQEKQCGVCRNCRWRRQAFADAHIADPTEYMR